jgi:hypothetical protein
MQLQGNVHEHRTNCQITQAENVLTGSESLLKLDDDIPRPIVEEQCMLKRTNAYRLCDRSSVFKCQGHMMHWPAKGSTRPEDSNELSWTRANHIGSDAGQRSIATDDVIMSSTTIKQHSVHCDGGRKLSPLKGNVACFAYALIWQHVC